MADLIDAYITTNVTDLTSAKSTIAVMVKDLAQTMVFLKIAMKLSVFLTQRELG